MELDDKRARVQNLFETIAPGYDRLNRLLSLSRDRSWRALAVSTLGLGSGDLALDLCCGTGDFLTPLKETGASAYGFDFALPMLRIAQRKGLPELALADAGALPIASGIADAVTVGWGLRNVPSLAAALRESRRVLKTGGRFAALDTMVPTNPVIRAASRATLRRAVPLLGGMFGQREAYRYLPESTQTFATPPELVAAMAEAGFADAGYRTLMLGNVVLLTGRAV